MDKKEPSIVLQRFLSYRSSGKNAYFDADEIEELLDLFEEEDDFALYDEALQLGLQLHPQSQDLIIRFCDFLIDNQRYEEALQQLRTIGHPSAELDKLTLECQFMLGQYDPISSLLQERQAESCSYLKELYEYIISVALDEEFFVKAEQFILQARKLYPESTSLKMQQRYALEALKRYDEAIEICNELIDKDPYSAEQWDSLGRLYSLTQQFDKAIEAFEFALTCKLDSPTDEKDIKILRAFCFYMNQNYSKAIEAYKEFDFDLESVKREVWPMMAECYIRINEIETAYKLLNEYLDAFDVFDDPNLYMHYIRCCVELEHEDRAAKEIEKALQHYPDDLSLLALILLIYYGEHKQEQIDLSYERILQLLNETQFIESTVVENLINSCLFMVKENDTEKALTLFLLLAARCPNGYPEIYMYISMLYMEQDDTDNALKYAKMAKLCQNKTDLADRVITEEELDDVHVDIDTFMNMIQSRIPNEEFAVQPASKQSVSKTLVDQFLKNKDNKN